LHSCRLLGARKTGRSILSGLRFVTACRQR
jgi:hypothetical protein